MPPFPVGVFTHQRNHDLFSFLLAALLSVRACQRTRTAGPPLPRPKIRNSRAELSLRAPRSWPRQTSKAERHSLPPSHAAIVLESAIFPAWSPRSSPPPQES